MRKVTGSTLRHWRFGVLALVLRCATQRVPPPPTISNSFRVRPPDFGVVSTGVVTRGGVYVPSARTQNPQSVDGVTIEVTPLGMNASNIGEVRDVFVACQTPDDRPMVVSVVGVGLFLTLRNDTGHIVTTERSALQVEDASGTSFPIRREDWSAWVALVVASVHDRYESFRGVLPRWQQETRAAIARHGFISESYRREYDAFVSARERCLGGFSCMRDATSCGYAEDEERLQPENQRGLLWRESENTLRRFSDQAEDVIRQRERSCMGEITRHVANPPVRFLNEATFERLRVLPGQTVRAYIPLDPSTERQLPADLHVRLYDLVSQTDAAGNPTRRAHFDFRLQRSSPVAE